MSDELYVDEDGYMVDAHDNYITDEDGLPLTEDEFDAMVAQESQGDESEFVDAMAAGYHRLKDHLGREPSDAELTRLMADAEITGDPNIDKAYERVTKRPLEPNLSDDETRIRVFAEYAQEAADASDPLEPSEVGQG